MVFLTFVIGVLNLCLGYALAVHLSHGPPGLRDAWHALSARPPSGEAPAEQVTSEPSVLAVWKTSLATEASRLAALGDRLRECEGLADSEGIRTCASELREACEAASLRQSEAAEQLREWAGQTGAPDAVGDELDQAVCEQLAQLEATAGNLRHVDLEFDLPATGRQLTSEIDRVLAASRRVWSGLDAAFASSPTINLD